MNIQRVALKYCGTINPGTKKELYDFLKNRGFEPFAERITQDLGEYGELKYFVLCENSSMSRLENDLKGFRLPIEILPEERTGVSF